MGWETGCHEFTCAHVEAMSLRVKNFLVVALTLLAVNFAFCAALMRARGR
jgi:hypothetical protein